MKSLYIPHYYTINIYKAKNNKNIIFINNNNNNISLWFLSNHNNIIINNRIITTDSITIRYIKKSLINLKNGYIRTLKLLGVGYKANKINHNTLSIKVSSIPPFIFNIPNDISIKIDKNNIIFWSYLPTKMDHFIKQIILKVKLAKWN